MCRKESCHVKNTYKHVVVPEGAAQDSLSKTKLSAPSMPICHVLFQILPFTGSAVPKLKMILI